MAAKLPDDPTGLWPAVWLLGNLGRGVYLPSTDGLWPYSSSVCNAQTRDCQLLNGCAKHPQQEYGMQPFRGRGSPEIVILEVYKHAKTILKNDKVKLLVPDTGSFYLILRTTLDFYLFHV